MQVWRTNHSTNDRVTSYTISFVSLLRTKNILDNHSPLDCDISWDVIPMKRIEKNSYYGKQQGIWRVLGLEPKGKCGRMCFAADCYEKKSLVETILAGVGETEELLTEVQCWAVTQLGINDVLTAISAPWQGTCSSSRISSFSYWVGETTYVTYLKFRRHFASYVT